MQIITTSVESFCAFSFIAPAPGQNVKDTLNASFDRIAGREMREELAEPVTVIAAPVLSKFQRQQIEALVDGGRAAVIKGIKDALQRRSGKQWSVTGGKGTAYGWLRIDAPPARRTWKHRPLPPGGNMPGNENWEEYDAGEAGNNTSPQERAELGGLLGLDPVHTQGHSIPSSHDYYRLALCQSIHGHDGGYKAEQYWD